MANASLIISLGTTEMSPVPVDPNEKISFIIDRIRNTFFKDSMAGSSIDLSFQGRGLSETRSLTDEQIIPDQRNVFRVSGVVRSGSVITSAHIINDVGQMKITIAQMQLEINELKETIKKLADYSYEELRKRPKSYSKLYYPGDFLWIWNDESSSRPLASAKHLCKLVDNFLLKLKLSPQSANIKVVGINGNVFKKTLLFDLDETDNSKNKKSDGSDNDTSVDQSTTRKIEVSLVRVLLPSSARIKDSVNFQDEMQEHLAIVGWTCDVYNSILQKEEQRSVRLLSDASPLPIDDEYYLFPVSSTMVPTEDSINSSPVLKAILDEPTTDH